MNYLLCSGGGKISEVAPTNALHLYKVVQTRADQNTGGALLESPMRTAMHGKSRVSSAISVELN